MPKSSIVKRIKKKYNKIIMRRYELAINQLLIKKKKTIAVAESCTGGLLANLLTNVSGSSQYFLLGVVAYSNKVKISLLKIPALTIKRYGAVSAKVAQLMAQNVKKIASSDYGIGIPGIAGPLGGSPKKPIGTVFISVSGRKKSINKRFRFRGSRRDIKRKTAIKAISILKKIILRNF